MDQPFASLLAEEVFKDLLLYSNVIICQQCLLPSRPQPNQLCFAICRSKVNLPGGLGGFGQSLEQLSSAV